ncbi:MAG: GlsB/YeaQ/YmgE family stress response membrane protein [Bacteroidetes bacterium]|nr:GlsB/YeaQ/YmgE family stress response membrane protein [Bacteroidota bacterium]
MIGMDFISFLILLVISVVVSLVLHFFLKTSVRGGLESLFGKIVWGWIGAWLGSPVFGYWFPGLNYHAVYIIPAILGSLALLVLMVDLVKSVKGTP